MKTFFLLVLAAVAVSLVVSDEVYSANELAEWNTFKNTHGRTYDEAENNRRLKIYMDNKKRIEEHNQKFAAGEVSYRLSLNQFADKLPEELPHGR